MKDLNSLNGGLKGTDGLTKNIAAIVIGVSQGGMKALEFLLPALPNDFAQAIVIVQHRSADSGDFLSEHLNLTCNIRVKEAEEKEAIVAGTAYVAPADYHLLVETDGTLALNFDERINYTRPSIDVLFESAADCYGERLLGIVLTGNNSDGALGLKVIGDAGGITLVQEPTDAEVASMPEAAIATAQPNLVLDLAHLRQLLLSL